MQKLIEEIVREEWDSFQQVQNIGGRAACQDDRATFEIMRKSQFMAWKNEVCESYLNDLISARQAGRNLLAEKYAHMMKETSPGEYLMIKDLLPPVSLEAEQLAEKIVSVHLRWQKAYSQEFPYLSGAGRPVGDTSEETSVEVYLRGELLTYSVDTLRLYLNMVQEYQDKNINLNRLIQHNTVQLYGYASLGDAEQKLRAAKRMQ